MKSKKTLINSVAALLLCSLPAVQAQVAQPVIPPGKLAVFKAGTTNNAWPMLTSRVAPCFVQVFDPSTTFQTVPVVSVAMSITSTVPGAVWINHHAGSEGGGISRSLNRQFLCLEGYTGNILSPTASKPSTDPTVSRGIVTLDAFTNAISVFSDVNGWFGIPVGANPAQNQDNPTGIASTDGTNFWGTGNFAGTSAELDGTLFYNASSGSLQEVQQFIQAAGEARIIGGMLLIATKSGGGSASGLYNFIDPFGGGEVVPLPWDPDVANPYFNFATTNLYMTWGNTFKNVLNFDMDPARTVAYGADQTFGVVKFVNNSGTWVQAPYYFSATNLGTLAQASGNQGCFGICVDFSGANPVIYATTMENGTTNTIAGGLGVNTAAGHQNNNRLIKIVDTGVAPGTAVVAQTLAVAPTTNEFFGGIDFTPDLRPLILSQSGDYATTVGASGTMMTVTAQSPYALSYHWYENGSPMNTGAYPTAATASLDVTTLTAIDDYNAMGFTNHYQCVITNSYGSVTSSVANLFVTVNPTAPVITSGTNRINGFINGTLAFANVTAAGTQPFTYQWYFGGAALVDDGIKYVGSTTPSLTVSNLLSADAGGYYMVIKNPSSSYASNIVDILTVNYQKAAIIGQPLPATTFVGVPLTVSATSSGGTPPITNQWYKGSLATGTMLSDGTEYSGSGTASLTIAATTTADTGNYFLVVSTGGGSVTSSVVAITVQTAPPHTYVNYTNQIYSQNFDSLPDPGSQGIAANGTASGNGASVNSINNPGDPGLINSVTYSLANPFDFGYPVIGNSYVGGLGLGSTLGGWYGAADTTLADGVDGVTRFGAQDGDQSTGGVIDFGLNDLGGGIVGTNRALGLVSTSTTGSTSFGVKLVNNSTNTLNYIDVSFIGELWRNNTGGRVMSFSYQVDPSANSFVLVSQPLNSTNGTLDLPNAITVPNMAFSFPTNPAGTLAVDGTQPANRVSVSTNDMVLGTPWAPGAALWLVWSIDFYSAGSGQGYAIDNLSVSGSVAPITQPSLNAASYHGGAGGSGFTLNFSNSTGASQQFTVWGNTNLLSPNWVNLGHPSEVSAGLYQFADSQATNKPTRFYKVTNP